MEEYILKEWTALINKGDLEGAPWKVEVGFIT
jgi:hypothetical protein